MLGVFVAHARVFHPAAGIPVAASGDVAVPNVFTSWVSEELVIAKSSPTHRRMRSTLGVSDGGPFPGSSAIGPLKHHVISKTPGASPELSQNTRLKVHYLDFSATRSVPSNTVVFHRSAPIHWAAKR
jgi:hypothetical protein